MYLQSSHPGKYGHFLRFGSPISKTTIPQELYLQHTSSKALTTRVHTAFDSQVSKVWHLCNTTETLVAKRGILQPLQASPAPLVTWACIHFVHKHKPKAEKVFHVCLGSLKGCSIHELLEPFAKHMRIGSRILQKDFSSFGMLQCQSQRQFPVPPCWSCKS